MKVGHFGLIKEMEPFYEFYDHWSDNELHSVIESHKRWQVYVFKVMISILNCWVQNGFLFWFQVSEDEVIDVLEKVLTHNYSTEVSKEYAMTSLMKLTSRFRTSVG